ncbi:hypothetical protein F5Y15DRAFT_428934 [Xylariaceae sp. FL0016]|nr:hypothetical protein F5Y15DRAFT_428934 [Xylariaceae sp. FL0016]
MSRQFSAGEGSQRRLSLGLPRDYAYPALLQGAAEPITSDHVYGFPNGAEQDRHRQSIINHTNNLFPDLSYHLPTFSRAAGNPGSEVRIDLPDNYQQHDEDFILDDFGCPTSSSAAPSSGNNSHRISLPLSGQDRQSPRILDDASHHFRPFIHREPDFRSPFCGESSQADSLEPASSTRAMIERNGPRRVGELQRGNQLATPPFYNSSKTPPVTSSITHSSPSSHGLSSPSTQISLRRQNKTANRPFAPKRLPQSIRSDLDHAPTTPPIVNNTRLVNPREALPDKFHSVFPYPLFNVVQSKTFPLVYGTNENVVISAPTGSGKTAILEMAICRLAGSIGGDNDKIVYQAPTKSLCSEKAREWEQKFSHMNLKCFLLTGDTSPNQASRLGSASIIATTPEKWDSITRKWKDHRKLLDTVRLVLIDEVHMLKDVRGATLEVVVSRMKTSGANVRFVALSATVPNIEDVAKWLGRDHANQDEPAIFETFGEELRPVKLQRYVYGYEGFSNDFAFDKVLDTKLTLLLKKHSQRKPIMIFCNTRKSCECTARNLAEWWSTHRASDKPWPAPSQRVSVVSAILQEIVGHGVAFHHAGLDVQDRAAVEKNFLSGQLHLICCTSTLAVGVNLPCHTVVLKGTCGYSDNELQEYSDLEVIQMLGRAGRPQFDDSACAIIMTRQQNVHRYERMISGEEKLESTLHENLVEHVNSEIGLGTIQNLETAKRWIIGTFLSVRVRQSPSLYNLQNVLNAAGADERMKEWCERDVKLLQEANLVTARAPFSCTEYGQAMSRYMVRYETMKLLLSIPRASSVEDMMTAMCQASEFRNIRFKGNERTRYREFNMSSLVLHPIKETISLPWHKVFLIIEVALGGSDLAKDGGFRRDFMRDRILVFSHLSRLVRCVADCKAFDGDGQGTNVALGLARSLAANAWEDTPAQLAQIPGFGPVTTRKMISHGVRTVLAVAEKSALDLERIVGRNPPYGANLLRSLGGFPRLNLKADIIGSPHPEASEPISVTLKVKLGHSNNAASPRWNDKIPTLTFLVMTTDGNLAYFWRGNMAKIDKNSSMELKFPVALTAPHQTITCYFSCEEIVGSQVVVQLEPKIPASAFRKVITKDQRSAPSELDLNDEVADEDMWSIVRESDNQSGSLKDQDFLDAVADDFTPIESILSEQSRSPSTEALPSRMDNGKWVCHHQCRNRGLLKSGKPCKHTCCREGLSHPRPPRQKKRGQDTYWGDFDDTVMNTGAHYVSQPQTSRTSPNPPSNQVQNKNRKIGATTAYKSGEQREVPAGVRSVGPSGDQAIASRPKTRPCERKRSKTKNAKLIHKSLSPQLPSAVDYIDLSNVEDSGSDHITLVNKKSTSSTEKGRQKLLSLHENVQVSSPSVSRLTKRLKNHASALDLSQDSYQGVDQSLDSDGLEIVDDDMMDLPDLDMLLGNTHQDDACPSQNRWTSDETLYPGVVETLRESMEYGLESNLSFTTVDELRKAPERFDLISNNGSTQDHSTLSDLPPVDVGLPHTLEPPPSLPLDGLPGTRIGPPEIIGINRSHTLGGPEHGAKVDDLTDFIDPTVFEDANLEPTEEPAWVSEFDPLLMDFLRGSVNFVD